MSRSTRPSNPTNWDDYQYGTSRSRGSVSSNEARGVRFGDDDEGLLSAGDGSRDASQDRSMTASGTQQDLRRRRSSMTVRLSALAQAGGVNSISNFARSWSRAAGFQEVIPDRPAFVLAGDDDEEQRFLRADVPHVTENRTSLLRQHFEASPPPVAENAVEETDDESDLITPRPFTHSQGQKYRLGSELPSVQGSMRGSMRSQSIFAIAPHLSIPLAGSYGTSYGTLRSNLNESSMIHAGQLWEQQQAAGGISDGERPLVLVKEVEQDGKVNLVVVGQSTLPQTIFNSTNVLIGVGILSLPLGVRYSGWICGMIFLFLAAFVTSYTAKLLAKCMDVDSSLITFADLAFVSYGQKARIVTSILFTLELLAACVALVVLFADTLDLLFPSVGVVELKILCGILLIPLNFLPLRLLSFTSVLGIFSCFSIVLIVLIDGFIKPTSPGSVRDPAATYVFPANWLTLPLSFGLLMSPWGGHSVFPNIYRDMRHPHKYGRAVKTTFTFTYLLDAATAVAGLLMFGDDVRDEVTSNIIGNSSYPQVLSILLCVFIAIIPLTKLPLNARPIVATIEHFAGLDTLAISDAPALVGLSGFTRGLLKVGVRVCVTILFVVVAILFPAFDSIMAFMGSALCFTICVILPLLFYLKIFGDEIPLRERVLDWTLIVVCSALASIGTVFAFLPKSMIGAE